MSFGAIWFRLDGLGVAPESLPNVNALGLPGPAGAGGVAPRFRGARVFFFFFFGFAIGSPLIGVQQLSNWSRRKQQRCRILRGANCASPTLNLVSFVLVPARKAGQMAEQDDQTIA